MHFASPPGKIVGHSDPEIRGGRSPKNVFRPLGPQFGQKIRGGGPTGPSPRSAMPLNQRSKSEWSVKLGNLGEVHFAPNGQRSICKTSNQAKLNGEQFSTGVEGGSLHADDKNTLISTVCEAAQRSLFWTTNGLNELPEVRFEFPFNLIGNRDKQNKGLF